MFQIEVVEKIITLILCWINFFWKSCCLWDKVDKYGTARKPQMLMSYSTETMWFACQISKARIQTCTQYLILTAFLWQEWLHEYASMLCYLYVLILKISLLHMTLNILTYTWFIWKQCCCSNLSAIHHLAVYDLHMNQMLHPTWTQILNTLTAFDWCSQWIMHHNFMKHCGQVSSTDWYLGSCMFKMSVQKAVYLDRGFLQSFLPDTEIIQYSSPQLLPSTSLPVCHVEIAPYWHTQPMQLINCSSFRSLWLITMIGTL
jgi:hypothetical protein